MNSMFFNANNWQIVAVRLSVALLIGCVIGLNRDQPGRPAGLRTFMIVSLGAAVFVMIPLQIENDTTFASSNALSRTIQGVASGVGFLGAGIILQQSSEKSGKAEIKGLTSAATIWLAAGLGAAAGCGLWQMSLLATVMALVVLSGVKKLKKSNLMGSRSRNPQPKTQPKDSTTNQDIQQR